MTREILSAGIFLFVVDQIALGGKYIGTFANLMRSIRVWFGM
jgi:hypothetical protein